MSAVRKRRKREEYLREDSLLCKDCATWKPLDQYRYRAHRDSYETQCQDCRNLYRRALNFSITMDELRSMLVNGCNACGSMDRLTVDHDHACCPLDGKSCGKCIRGVLCHQCNTALGLLGDSIARINRLRDYVMAGAR